MLVTICSFVIVTYYYTFSGPIQLLCGLVGLLLACIAGFILQTQGKQVLHFAKEAKIELRKVVWPTRQETVQTTSIVMVMVAVNWIYSLGN